jgi:hypothetical protein
MCFGALNPPEKGWYGCCVTASARLNGYSLVVYETNRYSSPVNRAKRDVIVKVYPFHLDILDGTTLLAPPPSSLRAGTRPL